jgi:hypothetical protein
LVFGATEIPFVNGTYTLTPAELAAATKVADAPAAPSICFENNKLIVNGYEGKALVIKKDGSEIENVATLPAAYSKDLSAQTGRLVVTLDGKDYQIDANPTVKAYTPAP